MNFAVKDARHFVNLPALAREYCDIWDHFREVKFTLLPFIFFKERAGGACMGCDVASQTGLFSSEKRPFGKVWCVEFWLLQGGNFD